MVSKEENILSFVKKVSVTNLYHTMILQLRKDFELCGETIDIDLNTTPEQLIKVLNEGLFFVIGTKFDTYLQLLYRIDISEPMMSFSLESPESLARKVTFIVLKREWQKVKLRASYQ